VGTDQRGGSAAGVHLWLLLGETFTELLLAGTVVTIVATIIVLPLVTALATERLAVRYRAVAAWHRRSGVLPVPLVAEVVFLIATSQVNQSPPPRRCCRH
jgi:arsenite transporter